MRHFVASKCIIVVRNPLDTIRQFFNLTQAGSIELNPREELAKVFTKEWPEFVSDVSESLASYHEVLIGKISKKIPTFVIRVEDLQESPFEVM